MVDGALDSAVWGPTVRIAPARAVAEELTARRDAAPPARSVWVTDLSDLRSAYWRSVAPVEPTPERRALLDAGRETHVRVGHLLAPARLLEVRVQREGIVGQIDLLDDRPTELKTTALPRDAGHLRTSRASYVEQIAMYCALARRREGRLVLIDPGHRDTPAVAVYDVGLSAIDPVWAEMRRRADLLRDALDRRDPSALPACAWRGRGCEFESAEVCDCTGGEARAGSALEAQVETLKPNAALSGQLEQRLAVSWNAPAPAVRRFRDVLYPRRAYFERTSPPAEPLAGAPSDARPAGRTDLYRTISDLLEAGPEGDVVRTPTPAGEPMESVACFRGDPYLLKVSRAWSATPLDSLVRSQPQYLLELGLRCAALGRPSGWLIVGYERAAEWNERVYVYRVEFDPTEVLQGILRDRIVQLQEALRQRRPEGLPTCPAWMFEGCPYGGVCGCGPSGEGARS